MNEPQSGSKLVPAVGVVVGIAVICGAWWLFTSMGGPETTPSLAVENDFAFSRPDPPPDGYVGSKACMNCHRDICTDYRTHPMANSMAAIGEEVPLETYRGEDTFEVTDSKEMHVRREGDSVQHAESFRTQDGELLYDQEFDVQYAVGSGKRGRSYLINHDGLLDMSPITWYASVDEWGLSPGYEPESNPRFERQVSSGCVACHAGRVNAIEKVRNRFQPKPFLEEAIGCERCHGPGREHIELQRSGLRGDQPDSIVNPADLKPALRDAICNQCHLQGEQRVLRYGRTEFDFRPGMALSEVWVAFKKTGDVSTKEGAAAVSHVEQMHASRCYSATRGAASDVLTCLSCHPPHHGLTPAERVSHYRQSCLQCHSNEDQTHCGLAENERLKVSSADSCIQCHMPKHDASDVPHTAQTDHRIRIPGQQRASGDDQSPMNAIGPPESRKPIVFREPGYKLDKASAQRALAVLMGERAYTSENQQLARQVLPTLTELNTALPDDLDSIIVLGMAQCTIGDIEGATRTWEAGLEHWPEDEQLLDLLASTLHEFGDYAAARKWYERLLAVNDTSSTYYGRYAHVLGRLQEFELGIKAAERTIELNPSLPQAHLWLAETYELQGNSEKSRFHKSQAQKLMADLRVPR